MRPAIGAARSLGELFTWYRQQIGLTQEEVAERTGLSVQAIRNIELGVVSMPRRHTTAALIAALGIDARDAAFIEKHRRTARSRRHVAPLAVHRVEVSARWADAAVPSACDDALRGVREAVERAIRRARPRNGHLVVDAKVGEGVFPELPAVPFPRISVGLVPQRVTPVRSASSVWGRPWLGGSMQDQLAHEFEGHRERLRSMAYRILGSVSDAEDAVQEAWLRLSRSDATVVLNLGGWLTTVVGRVCLDMLRARESRREEPIGVHLPDPIVSGPEEEAVIADAVGLAMPIVLDTLTPAERLVFVLHDMFAIPFAEIGPIVGRTPAAAKQLASRARQRVRGAAPVDQPDIAQQQRVVDAFFAATRAGDFDALIKVLDPDVVTRSDGGKSRSGAIVRGAVDVARQALTFARLAEMARPVLVNGSPGILAETAGETVAIMAFTIAEDRIREINILIDPERLQRL
jgi:RNA polymerase sigma factor (sigma-70 family)